MTSEKPGRLRRRTQGHAQSRFAAIRRTPRLHAVVLLVAIVYGIAFAVAAMRALVDRRFIDFTLFMVVVATASGLTWIRVAAFRGHRVGRDMLEVDD